MTPKNIRKTFQELVKSGNSGLIANDKNSEALFWIMTSAREVVVRNRVVINGVLEFVYFIDAEASIENVKEPILKHALKRMGFSFPQVKT